MLPPFYYGFEGSILTGLHNIIISFFFYHYHLYFKSTYLPRRIFQIIVSILVNFIPGYIWRWAGEVLCWWIWWNLWHQFEAEINSTQGSDALFDVKPPPQLSFRLPLLFLTNYQILWSKYPDFVVWKQIKWIKFWRTNFF